jgi:hypothetical protein
MRPFLFSSTIGWAPGSRSNDFLKVGQFSINDKYVINNFLMFYQLAFNGPDKKSGSSQKNSPSY